MDFEQTTCLTMDGKGVHCTLRILDGNLLLEIEAETLTEAERKTWASKFGTVKRRFPELADFTEMVVETAAEAQAREEALRAAQKPVKKTKKREAKDTASQELAEVREALKAAGISRAKLIRVLNSVSPRYSPVSETAIKKIL